MHVSYYFHHSAPIPEFVALALPSRFSCISLKAQLNLEMFTNEAFSSYRYLYILCKEVYFIKAGCNEYTTSNVQSSGTQRT